MRVTNPLARLLIASVFSLTGNTTQASDYEYDPDNGEEINEVCAGCHGEFGQGGKAGEYPRIASMPAAFLSRQLHLFRDRKRPNLAMVEYIDERQMPDNDIEDVSIFLSKITLKTKLPPADETDPGFDAYQRLLDSRRLTQIPIAPGNTEKGQKIYKKECGSCHGKAGWGDREDAVPQLAGQYTNYLWRQVEKYRKKIRIHDPNAPDEELLLEFTDEQLRDVFAYLSIVDD